MRFARLALKVLLLLLLLLVGIGFLLPSSASVERSSEISATAEQIFPYVNDMRTFHSWSPWSSIDPSTEYRFSGPEQGVGSTMAWQSGDQRVGSGSQRIVLSEPNRRVDTELVFGDQGSGSTSFLLQPEGDKTRVSWRFHTEFGLDLFSRYVGLMLDKMIGAAYERGLRTLKSRVEQPQPTQ